MNDLLLKKHMEIAPRMAPQDAVKLAYQSAFGCGHLLCAENELAARIENEIAHTTQNEKAPVFTDIGEGLCRMELSNPQVRRLGGQMIARMMILSDAWVCARKDNHTRFEKTLAGLTNAARSGLLPFEAAELEAYLAAYRAQGCPVVSHTEQYREHYHPAYRVIRTDAAVLTPVLLAMNERIDQGKKAVCVLDGPCGSGKSTLANLLSQLVHGEIIRMDDFFLPYELRKPERLAEIGGNVHYERFAEEVLKPLEKGDTILYGVFDCQTGRVSMREVPDTNALIIEGSYSHHPAFENAYRHLGALKVRLTVEENEQLKRLKARNPERFEIFVTRWIPLEKKYFEAYDSPEESDINLCGIPWETEDASR